MKAVKVNERLSVTGQLSPHEMAMVAEHGFAVAINNRPDGEEAGQPTAEQLGIEAARHGLRHVHIPVRHPDITEAAVRRFQEALAGSDGPVLAYCRSGTRSLTLWAIGEVLDGRMTLDETRSMAGRLGFDLSGVQFWIGANRPSPSLDPKLTAVRA